MVSPNSWIFKASAILVASDLLSDEAHHLLLQNLCMAALLFTSCLGGAYYGLGIISQLSLSQLLSKEKMAKARKSRSDMMPKLVFRENGTVKDEGAVHYKENNVSLAGFELSYSLWLAS